MRTNEPLQLDRDAVDLASGVLTIHGAKFGNYAALLTMLDLDVGIRKFKGKKRKMIGIV